MGSDAVVACSLNRGELADRGQQWDRPAGRAFAQRVPTERGLRLVFRREDGVENGLRELARLEKKCCAFADWTVTVAGERVLLDVSGSSDEAVAAVQSMFTRLGDSRVPR